jgi:hypothetical protein
MSLSPVMAMRAAGLLAGVCLVAVVALQTWRVPASPSAAGAQVELRAVPTGEVGVAPAGPVLRGSLVADGPGLRGRVRLSNRTAQSIAVRPRVTGGDPALDRLVELELTVAGRVVYRGPLGGLRDGVSTSVPLRPSGSATVRAVARVAASAGDEAAAREGRWQLTFSERG